ncbi:MAG: flavin reductase family protein [Deltaproteobacteria bacterium]|nr:flavin reductase family protein [Deltaproteobacteria bacterium]
MKTKLGPQTMLFPMPAVLIGTYTEDGRPNAMTAAWSAICCMKPICAGVAVRDVRMTFDNITRAGAFTINVPRATQAAEVDYLGIVSGAKVPDKMEVAGMECEKGAEVDAPILTSCPVNLECQLVERTELGTHTWFVGEVVEVHVDDDLVGDKGKLDIAALDPLIYVTNSSEYRRLGEVVGKAYSIGKTLKKGN